MPVQYVVAAVGVVEWQGYVLLLRRSSNHPNGDGDSWEVPSGRLEPGESFEQGILREIREETGLEVEVLAPVSTWLLPERSLIGVTFACRVLEGMLQLTSEHTDYRWIEPEKAAEFVTKPSLAIEIERWLAWRSIYLQSGGTL